MSVTTLTHMLARQLVWLCILARITLSAAVWIANGHSTISTLASPLLMLLIRNTLQVRRVQGETSGLLLQGIDIWIYIKATPLFNSTLMV